MIRLVIEIATVLKLKITGTWPSDYSVRRVVGRPEFDSLAELDQKTLKVSIHSFPLTFSILKG